MTGMTSRTMWRQERFVGMPVSGSGLVSARLSGYGLDAAAERAVAEGFLPTSGICLDDQHPTKGLVGS